MTNSYMDFHNNQNLKEHFEKCYFLYKHYQWMLDSYIVDFFVEKYWEKLQPSWKNFFENSDPQTLADLLNYDQKCYKQVLPLSMLATKQMLRELTLPRYPTIDHDLELEKIIFPHIRINGLFWKRVKKKKVYEVCYLAKKVADIVKHTQIDVIVDCGSGLGHLARLLAYKYKLKIVCLEAQESLTKGAIELDEEFVRRVNKYDIGLLANCKRPQHINFTLTTNLTKDDLLKAISVKNSSTQIGLIGLHPCGDLASVLLRLFHDSNQISCICMIGCCYMKATEIGYPLTDTLKNKRLSYAARELACHAIEQVVEQIQDSGFINFRTHSWRAALEVIVVKYCHDMRRAGLRSVQYSSDITFKDYSLKALEGSNIMLCESDFESPSVKSMLKQVDNVVVFNLLRTIFAPLLETIILLDRLLYLNSKENITVFLEPVFNPLISPRNHLLIAKKNTEC